MILKFVEISYLKKCIKFEVAIGNKTCNFITLHRSLSQAKDEFLNSVKNLELNLKHIAFERPFLAVRWFKCENAKLDNITTRYDNFSVQFEPHKK